jgi:hypothetical protein
MHPGVVGLGPVHLHHRSSVRALPGTSRPGVQHSRSAWRSPRILAIRQRTPGSSRGHRAGRSFAGWPETRRPWLSPWAVSHTSRSFAQIYYTHSKTGSLYARLVWHGPSEGRSTGKAAARDPTPSLFAVTPTTSAMTRASQGAAERARGWPSRRAPVEEGAWCTRFLWPVLSLVCVRCDEYMCR